MSLASSASVAHLELVGNPLAEVLVRAGRVQLRSDLEVVCGQSFVWWTPPGKRRRQLARVVAAAEPAGRLAGRLLVMADGFSEHLVFSDEVSAWRLRARGGVYRHG